MRHTGAPAGGHPTLPPASRADSGLPVALGEIPLIYESASFRKVVELADQAARADCFVLLLGETGTGKGRIARYIHETSSRRESPLVVCSAPEIPDGLEQNELFGHTKEAFSGAESDRPGLFQAAQDGTLLLDDADKFRPGVQPFLLRYFDDHCVRPVGSIRFVRVDVRVIAATNRDLRRLSDSGSFLLDLAYRLSEMVIEIPPLRERPEDIVLLANHFAAMHARRLRRTPPRITDDALRLLASQPWRGNVRELSSVIMNGVARLKDDSLGTAALLEILGGDPSRGREAIEVSELSSLPIRERRTDAVIRRALELSRWNFTLAARTLGIALRTFQRDCRRLGIRIRDRQISAPTSC